MINKKDLFAEFNSTEGKKFREANQLIRSFLKNSGLEMDTDNIPDYLGVPLKTALNYWLNLIDDEIEGFRSELSNRAFHSILYDAIVNKNKINYITIICPSYKKGKGSIGFKKEPGATTYIAFKNIRKIYENTVGLGISADFRTYFYDLAVENAQKLSEQDWRDFELNILLDKTIARALDISYESMSVAFPVLKKQIGRYGVVMPEEELLKTVPISRESLDRVINESKIFYIETFGWTEEEALKRALCQSHAYGLESIAIRRHFKNPVILYSAYSYERMSLYTGKDGSARVGIICPKKVIGNSLSPTISTWKNKKQ